jgi:hypothetical protein
VGCSHAPPYDHHTDPKHPDFAKLPALYSTEWWERREWVLYKLAGEAQHRVSIATMDPVQLAAGRLALELATYCGDLSEAETATHDAYENDPFWLPHLELRRQRLIDMDTDPTYRRS